MGIWPKRKPRPNIDEYGRSSLWELSFKGDLQGVKEKLNEGADPNQGDDRGYTPLQVAIQEKHFEVVEYLLANGSDPNQKDINGNTPLWTAVTNWAKDERIILWLLERGADPQIENNYENSPFSVIDGMDGKVGEFMKTNFNQNT